MSVAHDEDGHMDFRDHVDQILGAARFTPPPAVAAIPRDTMRELNLANFDASVSAGPPGAVLMIALVTRLEPQKNHAKRHYGDDKSRWTCLRRARVRPSKM
jgi:hypothetical protein